MQYFSYKAIDNKGKLQRGSISAENLEEASARISQLGMQLIVCKSCRLSFFKARRGSVSRKQLIDFTFHLQQMLEAGVPVLDTLKEYRDTSEQRCLQLMAGELLDKIESGSSLSQALALQSNIFKPMYTSMVQAGEESGRLSEVLADLLALLKWQDETVSSIRRVLIYPAFVCVVLMVVIGFVMAWLVPSLVSFITSAGGELPWHTQWLIRVSDIITDYGLIVIGLLLAGVVLLNVFLRSDGTVRRYWHTVQLKLPLAGPVLYKIKLARFSRCAALMYSSGVNLIDTLKQGEALVDNHVLSVALRQAREKIINGEKVADAFQSQPHLPPLLSRLIRVGESTGAMDAAFLQTSYFYDRDSREAIERLEQFIGPILIIIVGAVMSWVVLSVIGPIYDLVFSMQEAF